MRTVMPSAAAWLHILLYMAFPEVPRSSSQSPKLSLRIGARPVLEFVFVELGKSMTYCAARSPPKWPAVDFEVTRSIVAFLATAPDHSTSRMASTSSLLG